MVANYSKDFDELKIRLAEHLARHENKVASDESDRILANSIVDLFFDLSADQLSDSNYGSIRLRIEKLKDAKLDDERVEHRKQELFQIWKTITNDEFVGDQDIYLSFGKLMLNLPEPLIAYDIFRTAIEKFKNPSLELRQKEALALARIGATEKSVNKLRELRDEGNNDPETLSLLAGRYKTRWEEASDELEKNECLEKSYQLYKEGYETAAESKSLDAAYYSGVNTATLALLKNDSAMANTFAEKAANSCRAAIDFDEANYWAHATLGECKLILGDIDAALQHYDCATNIATRNDELGHIHSTKRNAIFIANHLGLDVKAISRKLSIPSVAVFTGHMTDYRAGQLRFPHSAIDSVKAKLKEIIDRHNIWIGFASAACGADLIFLEILKELGIRYRVVLPFKKEKFVETSVNIDKSFDWEPKFEDLLKNAFEVNVVNEYSNRGDSQHFEYTNRVMTGLAFLQARFLGSEVVPISVWDESPDILDGGTGSAVRLWQGLGWNHHNVNPTQFIDNLPTATPSAAKPVEAVEKKFNIEIKAMLFADVVGYSQISEEEIPSFVDKFMLRIAQTIENSGVKIRSGNTWGDAIYFVFDRVEDAGRIALEITEMVDEIDWTTLGFERQLRLRTGLHVGPVYRLIDPITKKITHSGAHVSRAARIEPITPPGEVYASSAFAAYSFVENVESFECDYVGIVPMAKKYGNFATYHVRRR